MTEKIRCTKCRKLRAASSFAKDGTFHSGLHPWCKGCKTKHDPSTKFQDPEAPLNGNVCPLCDTPCRGRASRKYCSDQCRNRCAGLASNYGMSVADYRRLVEDAQERCPICLNRPSQWHVDHNHRTGMATGIVCASCNVGALAGTFHDVEFVRRLLAFLEETPCERLGIVAEAPEGATRPSRIHSQWNFGRRP